MTIILQCDSNIMITFSCGVSGDSHTYLSHLLFTSDTYDGRAHMRENLYQSAWGNEVLKNNKRTWSVRLDSLMFCVVSSIAKVQGSSVVISSSIASLTKSSDIREMQNVRKCSLNVHVRTHECRTLVLHVPRSMKTSVSGFSALTLCRTSMSLSPLCSRE